MALLQVQGLEKWYGRRKVVDGVSFEVNPGEVVGLLGPNGAGKTTSFRMATGQITPNGGTVIFDDKDVTDYPMFRRARLGMGYLSQEQSIFRKLTVERNLIAILEALPRSRKLGRRLTSSERWQRTEEALARFNLQHVRKNVAARCSGGEKRRLEIARCLVCEPQLILLDEPFAAVDPKTTEDIRKNIRDLADTGIGILLTDHNVREVVKTADRIYLIVEGKVVCQGTPEKLIRDPIAIDAYLGSTFEDDALLARVAGFAPSSEPLRTLVPVRSEPPTPRKVEPEPAPSKPEMQFAVFPTAPTTPTVPPPPPVKTPEVSTGSSHKLSAPAQAMLDGELMRRAIDALKDRERMPDAWHQLASRGTAAIPVLLEALERRDLEIRHLAFRLLEAVTGETLDYKSDAPDDVRLRQVALLRARLEGGRP